MQLAALLLTWSHVSVVDLFFIIVFSLFAIREAAGFTAWARDRLIAWLAWHLEAEEFEDDYEPEE